MLEQSPLDLEVRSVERFLEWGRSPGERWQVRQANGSSSCTRNGELNDQLELGHVAGPLVVDERRHRGLVDTDRIASEHPARTVDRDENERRDVLASFAKRGDEERVFPEERGKLRLDAG